MGEAMKEESLDEKEEALEEEKFEVELLYLELTSTESDLKELEKKGELIKERKEQLFNRAEKMRKEKVIYQGVEVTLDDVSEKLRESRNKKQMPDTNKDMVLSVTEEHLFLL